MKIRQPPYIQGHQIDYQEPLTQLAIKRMRMGRDLKVIITAEDSETGTGKTTCAGWYALAWNWMFSGNEWSAEDHATLNPMEYFQLQQGAPPGTVLVVDDAEELDARRSMQHMNVEFSHRWMLMRVRQTITIITLPSPAALDRRLEELADVWINVRCRGAAMCHDIRVQSYGSRKVMTKKVHELNWPNVAEHPEIQRLAELKEQKIDGKFQDAEKEEVDPADVERKTKIETAQRMRDNGQTVQTIADSVGMSKGWVSEHTTAPDQKKAVA